MFTLSLKSPTTLPMELVGITPDQLQGKSRHAVEQLSVWHGKNQVALGELFTVEQDDIEDQLQFIGDLSSSVGLGVKMKSGMIRVEGNAGRIVGLDMWAGEIVVTGNVGDNLGAEMHGGLIRVFGSAGNSVGAARAGSTRGMTGGTILISGDAGSEVGSRMRRGLIAIKGVAGELAGRNMMAGTIVVGGDCGDYVGVGMKRGTICLLKPKGAKLLPTFGYACVAHSPMLGLVGRELQSLGFENDVWNANRQWQQYNGDFLASGKGELFLASA